MLEGQKPNQTKDINQYKKIRDCIVDIEPKMRLLKILIVRFE
jgi:hypothetical protein